MSEKGYITINELMKMDIPELEFWVDNLVPKNMIVLIAGAPESLKSFTCQHIAFSCSQGLKVFGKKRTEKSRVLYIDSENNISINKTRYSKLAKGAGLTELEDNITFILDKAYDLNSLTTSQKLELIKIIKTVKPDIIVFDSLVRFMIGDENSVQSVRGVFKTTKELMKLYPFTAIFIHHTRKSGQEGEPQDIRGSGDILGAVDYAFTMRRKKGKFILKHAKSRIGPRLKDIYLELKEEDNGITLVETEKPMEITSEEAALIDILTWMKTNQDKQEFKAKEILEEFESKYTRSGVYKALNKGEEENLIKDVRRGYWKVT